jgi:AcrR family transcriptional regulator
MAGAGEPGAEDLTARARIRDAAMELFAAHGVRGTTIRGVAEAAGVSPGLVQHHFGSKQGLREACDDHVMESIRRLKTETLDGGMADPGVLSTVVRASVPLRRYLARALVDGSSGAARLFDESVEFTKEMLESPPPGVLKPRTSDLHAYAVAMTSMSFGVVALHEHLSRALGADTLSVEGYPRLAKALIEVFTQDILSPELAEQSMTSLDKLASAADPDGDDHA